MTIPLPDLLPCPWCGKMPIASRYSPVDIAEVKCTFGMCPMQPSATSRNVNLDQGMASAVERWNTRAEAQPGEEDQIAFRIYRTANIVLNETVDRLIPENDRLQAELAAARALNKSLDTSIEGYLDRTEKAEAKLAEVEKERNTALDIRRWYIDHPSEQTKVVADLAEERDAALADAAALRGRKVVMPQRFETTASEPGFESNDNGDFLWYDDVLAALRAAGISIEGEP